MHGGRVRRRRRKRLRRRQAARAGHHAARQHFRSGQPDRLSAALGHVYRAARRYPARVGTRPLRTLVREPLVDGAQVPGGIEPRPHRSPARRRSQTHACYRPPRPTRPRSGPPPVVAHGYSSRRCAKQAQGVLHERSAPRDVPSGSNLASAASPCCSRARAR
jgi:hypothetical protein